MALHEVFISCSTTGSPTRLSLPTPLAPQDVPWPIVTARPELLRWRAAGASTTDRVFSRLSALTTEILCFNFVASTRWAQYAQTMWSICARSPQRRTDPSTQATLHSRQQSAHKHRATDQSTAIATTQWHIPTTSSNTTTRRRPRRARVAVRVSEQRWFNHCLALIPFQQQTTTTTTTTTSCHCVGGK